MATIIDALIVELGLDAADLEKKAPVSVAALKKLEGQGDKTEKSVKKISTTSKETARNVGELSRVVGSFLALIGGTVAIKAFVTDMITSSASLDRLSKNLGISVSTISAWSNAAEQLGGSAQGLQGTFDMLSKSQTQLMLTGESNLIPFFSALGVSLADVNGHARPVNDLLLDLSDRFSHLDRTTANNLGRMMGIDQGTMNLLLQGRKELELTLKRQKEYAEQLQKFAPMASKLQTQLIGLKQKFTLLGLSLLTDAAPAIEKVLNWFEKFANWISANREFVVDFLKVLAVGLGAIALAALPINFLVLAVIALAAGIALLWQDYQVWKRGGDSLIDWGKWEPGITAATKAIKALGEAAKTAWEFLEKLLGHSKLNGGAGHLGTNKDQGRATTNDNGGAGHLGSTRDKGATAKYIQDYFKKQGWNPANAAGIASNLISESGGVANKKQLGGGPGYGIAQWEPARQADFKKWSGKDIHDASLDDQLAFVQFELTQGSRKSAGDALKQTTNPKTSGEIVSRQYESPKDANGEAARRGAYAQSLLFGISGASSFAANAPGAAGTGTNVDKSVKTTIDTINIHTNATDAQGIADDMVHSLDFTFASQANYGLVP